MCIIRSSTRPRVPVWLVSAHHGSGTRAEAHAVGSAEASSWIAVVDGAAGGGGALMRTGGARGAGTYGGCEGGGGAAGT